MTASNPPIQDRAPIELPHRVRMEILFAVLLGDPARRPGPDDRRDRAAGHRDRSQRQRRLRLGLHRVPADRDDQRPDLREAVRPLRAAAHLPHRRIDLPARLAAVRAVAGDVAVHPLPRRPGPRRGRAVPGGARDHRRHLRAVRAGQVPGLLRSGVRPQLRHRAGDRRDHHRHDRLALDLLRQPAARRGRPRRDLAHAAAPHGGCRGPFARLRGRRAPDRRARADPRRVHQQADRRLDRPDRGRADRPRVHRSGRRSSSSRAAPTSRSCR